MSGKALLRNILRALVRLGSLISNVHDARSWSHTAGQCIRPVIVAAISRPSGRRYFRTRPHTLFSSLIAPLDAVMAACTARGTYTAVDLCTRIGPRNFAFIGVSPNAFDERKTAQHELVAVQVRPKISRRPDGTRGRIHE